MSKPLNRARTRRTGLLIAGAVLVVLVGIVATAYAIGGKDLFRRVFAGDTAQEVRDAHPGKVAVLVSPVPIAAFTALDPTALIDPKSGDFNVSWVTQKTCEEAGLLRDPSALRGRVLKHDKAAWLAFTEADFFPRGTQPSATAGIGPGQRGVTLSSADLPGLRSLKRGDTFDLVAVLEKTNRGSTGSDGAISSDLARAVEEAHSFETYRQTIAQNARIVQPVPEQAGRGGNRQPEEAFVAMQDDEFVAYTAAKAKGAKIQLAARSGLPGGDSTALADPPAVPEPGSIVIMSGGTSTRTFVPGTTPHDGAPDPKK